MAGIADDSVIDLVAQGADGAYLLVMIEERPWGSHPEQAAQLQQKINAYAGFILDGSLARQYPETEGQAIRIRLDCAGVPSGHFSHITDHAGAQLARHGIGFEVNPRK